MCGGRYGLLTEPTAWAIAHILGPEHEAAFIDEADVLFGRGARKESVRAVLNAGYTKDGVIAHMRLAGARDEHATAAHGQGRCAGTRDSRRRPPRAGPPASALQR